MLILGYRWRGGTCLKAVDCVDKYYVKGSIWVVIMGGWWRGGYCFLSLPRMLETLSPGVFRSFEGMRRFRILVGHL